MAGRSLEPGTPCHLEQASAALCTPSFELSAPKCLKTMRWRSPLVNSGI